MSHSSQHGAAGAAPSPPATDPVPPQVPEAFQATPNAERYVLQADALRRRQLRAALLYGSSRYWRRRQRVWPAAIFGGILSGVVAGVIVAANAFQNQQDINQDRFPGMGPAQETAPPESGRPSPGEDGATPGVPVPAEPTPGTREVPEAPETAPAPGTS